MAHCFAGGEPGLPRILQVRQLHAAELAYARECRGRALPATGVEHPVAGGHLVLHVPLDVLHARHLLAAG